MKKPKKSDSDYCNYKGFFSLVDTEYTFLWVDIGSSGHLKRGLDWHYFLLGDDAFALMSWMVKSYSRRQLTRDESIANYRIPRGSMQCGDEHVWNISEQVRGTSGHHGIKTKDCQRLFFTGVVLHNMLRTHQGRADRATTPANDVSYSKNFYLS